MSCWPDYRPTRRERFARWREWQRERLWRRLHPRQAAQQDAQRAAAWQRLKMAVDRYPPDLFNPGADIASAYVNGMQTGVDWTAGPDRTVYWNPPAYRISRLRRAWWAVLNAAWRVIEWC